MIKTSMSRRRWLKTAGALGLAAAAADLCPSGNAGQQPGRGIIDLGSRRELFVDGLLVDKLDGVRMVLHEPLPAGVAVKYDGPADERFSFYTTVLKDGDTYRMYYRGHPSSNWKKSLLF